MSPFEILYGKPFTLPSLIPFTNQREEEETLAEYMKKMLTKISVVSSISVQAHKKGVPEAEVNPGGWVFVKAIKRKHWHSTHWDGQYQVQFSTLFQTQ